MYTLLCGLFGLYHTCFLCYCSYFRITLNPTVRRMRVIAVVALAVPMRTDLHWELKHRTHISAALNQVIIYEWLSGAWGLNSGWCQE